MAGDTAGQAANVRPDTSERQKFLAYRVDLPGNRESVTVTFNYGNGDLRTLVAVTRKAAFAQAIRRWGDGWIDEPVGYFAPVDLPRHHRRHERTVATTQRAEQPR